MTPSRPILFATDLQAHSTNAFECASRLAIANEAKLIVVHVCNIPDRPMEGRYATYHERLNKELQEFTSSRMTPELDMESVFSIAAPGPEICRIAKERGCSMIVMGVASESAAARLPCERVHHFVEREATCPVVTLCQRESPTRSFDRA